MKTLHYKELISETVINPFDHPYVIINKEMEILGFYACNDHPIFTKAPAEGSCMAAITHPKIKDTLLEAVSQACNGHFLPSAFIELVKGSFVRIQVVTAPFEVQNSRYICFFETLQESQIKGNKTHVKASNGYSKSENIFYKAFHSAPIPLAIAKLKGGTLIEVNKALINKSNYSKKQLVGASAIDLNFWQNESDPIRIAELLQEKKHVRNHEVSFLPRQGKEVRALLNLDMVEINGEKCVLAIIQDITAIKQTEAKLKENEHLLTSINENLHEGIYRSSPEGGFQYLNKSFATMFGLTVEEAMKIDPGKLYADKTDRIRIKGLIDKEGFLKNEQIEFRKSDGQTFWGFLSGILTKDINGNFIYDGAIVDITDIRKSKVLLREKNDELKQINAELDRFVYSASHDLRAPLTSLLGLVNIALLEANDDQLVNYLNMMKGSVNKLDSLISDIIHFSRNARLGLTPEAINFELLVEEAIENLKYMSCTKSIRTETNISPTDSFYSDPKRLVILINNLVSNAFRYHDLTKEDPFICVKVFFEESQAIIEVTDNGRGIDPDHVHSIFEMFYRATTDSQGSGLGLYIVKETAEKLQGTISVKSELHKGTTFTLSIPSLQVQTA